MSISSFTRVVALCGGIISLMSSMAWGQDRVETEVRYQSNDITLAGTIFTPSGAGPHPGMVITHGSERASRKGRGYRYLGDEFAKLGFIVLIYDKRGVGDSEGTYQETPYMDTAAADVLAGIEVLKQQPHINASKMGVLGFSQGGWVGPLAATKSDDIGFVVSLVGPSVSIREQVLFHRSNEWRDRGWNEEQIEALTSFSRDLYIYLGTGEGYQELKPYYEEATQEPWFKELRDMGFGDALPPQDRLSHPVFDFFRKMRYDPLPTLQQVQVPMLSIFGAEDEHVPTERSVEILKEAFKVSGNDDLEIHVFEGIGHSLWQQETMGLYPEVRHAIWEWLEQYAQK